MTDSVNGPQFGYVSINTAGITQIPAELTIEDTETIPESVARIVSEIDLISNDTLIAKVAWTGVIENAGDGDFNVIAYTVGEDDDALEALKDKIDAEVKKLHNTVKLDKEGKTYVKGSQAPHNTNTSLEERNSS